MPMCFLHRGRNASSAPWPYTLPMAFKIAMELASRAPAAALNSASPAEGGPRRRRRQVDVLLEEHVEPRAQAGCLGARGRHGDHGMARLRLGGIEVGARRQ